MLSTKTILFDLDNTLIDTRQLMRVFIIPTLRDELGVTPTEFDEINDAYRQTLSSSTEFDPQAYLQMLADHFQTSPEALRELFFKPSFFEEAIFDDVIPVLESLGQNHQLGVFSQALIVEYQYTKLELSGLIEYFDRDLLFISHDKTNQEMATTLPEDTTVIDDRIRFLEGLEAWRDDLNLIWLNRASTEKHDSFTTIHSLQALV